MITVKQYADERGITIQAVHQSMNGKRKKERLDGHVQVIDGVKWLDEEAVAILDEARNKSPIVWEKTDANERIEELEREREAMLIKIAAQADRISELAQWKADNAMLIAGAEQTKMLLDNAQRDVRLLEGFVADAKAEILKAQEDAYKAECMVTQLQMENLELIDKEVGLQAEVAAKKALEDEIHLLQQENEQLRNRTFGDYLKGWFRKGPRA